MLSRIILISFAMIPFKSIFLGNLWNTIFKWLIFFAYRPTVLLLPMYIRIHIRSQSYQRDLVLKEYISLKMTFLVLNPSTVHCFNLDHAYNNTVVWKKLGLVGNKLDSRSKGRGFLSRLIHY